MSAAARAAGDPAEPGPGRPDPVRPATAAGGTPVRARRSTAPRAVPQQPERPAGSRTAPVRVGSAPARPSGTARSGSAGSGAAHGTAPVATPRPSTPPATTRARLTLAGSRRAPFVLMIVGLLVATTLGLLFLNTAIAVDSLKATQLAAANEDRSHEVQRLEQQVISGGTPGRLAAAAGAAGLVPAGTAGYLVIGADGSTTLRGEPVPAEDPARPGTGG